MAFVILALLRHPDFVIRPLRERVVQEVRPVIFSAALPDPTQDLSGIGGLL